MCKKSPSLLLILPAFVLVAAFNLTIAASARFVPAALLVSPAASGDNDTDRDRDGLQGPVRRVRTETSKLVSKGGQLAEGARIVLETATYDMKGVKIDNAYFLGAGGALTGKEVYKYDDRGNIVDMTLFNSDGSVLSKEKYDYEFDALGNWTKMTTSVAVIENGQMSFEPTEVTYRVIAYYLEDATSKRLQNAALADNTNAAANVVPASLSDAKTTPAAPVKLENSVAAQPKTIPIANTNAPAVKRVNNAPALPSGAAAANASTLALSAPVNAGVASANTSAPVVKSSEDVPPPPPSAKPVVKAPVRPISGGMLNSKALQMPNPTYPEAARHARVTGVVNVEVVVDVTGKVIGARAVSGPEMLRDAAERAAKSARFTPALLSGQPVKVSGVISYNFAL